MLWRTGFVKRLDRILLALFVVFIAASVIPSASSQQREQQIIALAFDICLSPLTQDQQIANLCLRLGQQATFELANQVVNRACQISPNEVSQYSRQFYGFDACAGGVLGGVWLWVAGGVGAALIVGAVVAAIIKRRRASYMPPATYPPAPQQAPPTCPTCGTPLQFIPQYQRNWCPACQQYK